MTYDEICSLIFKEVLDVHSQYCAQEGVRGAVSIDKSLKDNGIIRVRTNMYTRGYGPTGPKVDDVWTLYMFDIQKMIDVGREKNATEYISEVYVDRLDDLCDNLEKECKERRKASYGAK